MNLLCSIVDQLMEYELQDEVFEQSIFNFNGDIAYQKVSDLRRSIGILRDKVEDLLQYLEGHLSFSCSVLEHVHLESFSARTVKIGRFYEAHHDLLDKVFLVNDDGEIPPFPIVIPNIQQLSESVLSIENMSQWQQVKMSYVEEILPKVQQMLVAIPQKWPQTLPNLSTHNGKPRLQVSNQVDFGIVCGCYADYISRMEKLRTNWILQARCCYKFLESTKFFTKSRLEPPTFDSVP